jgi:hypothetical protein
LEGAGNRTERFLAKSSRWFLAAATRSGRNRMERFLAKSSKVDTNGS